MTIDNFIRLQICKAQEDEAYAQYNYWATKLDVCKRSTRIASLKNEGKLSEKDRALLRYINGGHQDALEKFLILNNNPHVEE